MQWEEFNAYAYFAKKLPGEELAEKNLFNEHVGKGIYYEQLLRWFALFPRQVRCVSTPNVSTLKVSLVQKRPAVCSTPF